jgi:hypothetical protein
VVSPVGIARYRTGRTGLSQSQRASPKDRSHCLGLLEKSSSRPVASGIVEHTERCHYALPSAIPPVDPDVSLDPKSVVIRGLSLVQLANEHVHDQIKFAYDCK